MIFQKALFDAQLSKPVKLTDLFELVLSVMSENRNRKKNVADHSVDKKLSDKLPLSILLAEDNFTNQELGCNADAKDGLYH